MDKADGGTIYGRADKAVGRKTRIHVSTGNDSLDDVERVRVVGRPDLTLAENACREFLLLLLLGKTTLQATPLIRLIWFPSATSLRSKKYGAQGPAAPPSGLTLNDSQKVVVTDMVHTTNPIVIAHGEHLRP